MVKDRNPLAHAACFPIRQVGGILRGEKEIRGSESSIDESPIFGKNLGILVERKSFADQRPVASLLNREFQTTEGIFGIFAPSVGTLGRIEKFLRAFRRVRNQEASQIGSGRRVGHGTGSIRNGGEHRVRITSEGFFQVTMLDALGVGFLFDPAADAPLGILRGFPDIQRPCRLVENIRNSIARFRDLELSIREIGGKRLGHGHQIPGAAVVKDAAIVVCRVVPTAFHAGHHRSVRVLVGDQSKLREGDPLTSLVAEGELLLVGLALTVIQGIPPLDFADILALTGFRMAGGTLPVCVRLLELRSAPLMVEALHHGKKRVTVAVLGHLERPRPPKPGHLNAIETVSTLKSREVELIDILAREIRAAITRDILVSELFAQLDWTREKRIASR